MEIIEVVTYFMNTETNMIEVSFRTIDDSEDMVRMDNIDFSIAQEYGFDLITEDFDFFGDELEDDDIDDDTVQLDTQELIIFLNEYYTINEDSLPKAEFY